MSSDNNLTECKGKGIAIPRAMEGILVFVQRKGVRGTQQKLGEKVRRE